MFVDWFNNRAMDLSGASSMERLRAGLQAIVAREAGDHPLGRAVAERRERCIEMARPAIGDKGGQEGTYGRIAAAAQILDEVGRGRRGGDSEEV